MNVYWSAIFCGQALLHFLGSEEGEAAVDRVLFYQLNACLNENQSEMTYERIVTRQTMHKKFGHCVSWETSVNSSCELNIIILTCASKTAIVRVAFGILISPSREIGHWSNRNRDIEVLAGRDIHWELTAGVHCIISVTTNQTNRIAKHSACHLKITMRLVSLWDPRPGIIPGPWTRLSGLNFLYNWEKLFGFLILFCQPRNYLPWSPPGKPTCEMSAIPGWL